MAGCSTNTTPDPTQASQNSAATGEQIGSVFTGLLEVVGDEPRLEIRRARENTYLRPENDEPQTKTRWIGLATGPVKDRSAAHDALERINQHLQADDWEKLKETDDRADEDRTLYFSKGDLGVTAELRNGTKYAKPSMEVFVSTPCIDQPVEHRMQRLEIDPDCGKNSQYHDDWK